jgi:type VI secretion system protein ImpL
MRHAGADAKLTALANLPPRSPRAPLAKAGYDQLKAYLMMARPDKADAALYAQVMTGVQPSRRDLSGAVAEYRPGPSRLLHAEPAVAACLENHAGRQLVTRVRQVLLEQIGRRNAESTLYENMLTTVRRNYADMTLEDMTPQTDAVCSHAESVPGMFTRQAWEGGIRMPLTKPWLPGVMKSTGC